jgi:hypothetical protein
MIEERTLGDVARELDLAAATVRLAIASAYRADMRGVHRDEIMSELAQAVVLLRRASDKFNSYCGMKDL